MNKSGQNETDVSFCPLFIMKEKRKPIKSRIRIWHGTCNITDEQENRRAGHVKTTESKGNEITKEQARWMYEKMLEIRKFEDKVHELFAQGVLPGFVHLYAGEEAVAVGVCAHLTDSDSITSTHRGHGHCIAKGCDLNGMMAELFGKATGLCKGKGGSMHIADLDKGMLGANGIVGGVSHLLAVQH